MAPTVTHAISLSQGLGIHHHLYQIPMLQYWGPKKRFYWFLILHLLICQSLHSSLFVKESLCSRNLSSVLCWIISFWCLETSYHHLQKFSFYPKNVSLLVAYQNPFSLVWWTASFLCWVTNSSHSIYHLDRFLAGARIMRNKADVIGICMNVHSSNDPLSFCQSFWGNSANSPDETCGVPTLQWCRFVRCEVLKTENSQKEVRSVSVLLKMNVILYCYYNLRERNMYSNRWKRSIPQESRCLLARMYLGRQASIRWVGRKKIAPTVIDKDKFILFCDNLDNQTFNSFCEKIWELRGMVIYRPPGKTDI